MQRAGRDAADRDALGRVFLCYSKEDAKHAERIRRHLEADGVPCMQDVCIAPGLPWRDVLVHQLDAGCEIALVLLSNHLLNTDFVRDVELPRIDTRWRDGTMLALRIDVGATWTITPDGRRQDRVGLPAVLTEAQWPCRNSPSLESLDNEGQRDRYQQVLTRLGNACLDASRATPRVRAWLGDARTPAEIRDEWRGLAPQDTPPPYDAGTVASTAWACALSLADHLRTGRSPQAAPGPERARPSVATDRRPKVRVILEPVPGGPDCAPTAWCVDRHGLRRLDVESDPIEPRQLPAYLGRVFTDPDLPLHTDLDRLELVCATLQGGWPTRGLAFDDGLGESPLGAPAVLRELLRARQPRLWDALVRRSSDGWREGTAAGIGPGGVGCGCAAQVFPANTPAATIRTGVQPAAAVCVGLATLPDAGPTREGPLAEAFRHGVPVVVWTDADGAPDAAELHALLCGAVGTVHRREYDCPQGVTILLDDPDDKVVLPDDFRSPT